MVPRIIWDHVVFGPKIDQEPGFLAKTPGKAFKIAQNWFLGTQKHPKNTQKRSKTLKNTQKHARDSSSHIKGTQGSLQNSKFCKKHKNPSVENGLDKIAVRRQIPSFNLICCSNMPATTLVTPKGAKGSPQNSKFYKKTRKFLCKGPKMP